MNTIVKSVMITLALPLILAGCGTTPASTYYLLSADESHFPSGTTPSLGVGPIEIPQYLNRNALVYNQEGNRLHIASFERWAEPLDSSITRVIRINLASLLDTQDVQSFPWSNSDKPDYAVEVAVLNLDANEDRARLVAEWHIYRAEKRETILRRVVELETSLATGPVTAAEVAPAYSNLLLQLSETIAAAISEDIAARSNNAATP